MIRISPTSKYCVNLIATSENVVMATTGRNHQTAPPKLTVLPRTSRVIRAQMMQSLALRIFCRRFTGDNSRSREKCPQVTADPARTIVS